MKTPLISKRKFNKIRKYLPVHRGKKRVNDLLVLSGIIFVIKNGLPWRQLPEIYGKWTTVYSRFKRWSKKGIFATIFKIFRGKLKKRCIAMLDSTYIKVHRTATSLRFDGTSREIGRTSGGLNTKIHLLCDEKQRPIDFCLTAGQVHDAKIALKMLENNFGRMKYLLADKAYDTKQIHSLLEKHHIQPCISQKANRKSPTFYDKELYKKRHVIENMFARLKDWRGLAMRYNRCGHTFYSFVCIALIFFFF